MGQTVNRLTVIRVDVRCKDCQELLDEPPDVPAELRRPCPRCGSTARERSVLMVPGEASPAAGSAERAWLDLGAALARAASALELSLREDELTAKQRAHVEKAWLNVLKQLEDYRAAQDALRRDRL